jgi:hypothetical protein
MRQSIGDRIYTTVFQHVKKLAVGTMFDVDVSACYAPDVMLAQQGQLQFVHSWLVTVSTPNPIVGAPAIAASIPVNGIVPPDQIFESAVEAVWERVRNGLDDVLKKPQNVGQDLTNLQFGGK